MPYKKPHYTADKYLVPQNGQQEIIEIPPRGLNVVWGNDSRYWKIPPAEGPVELIQVSWLEVSGVVPIKANKSYKVTFDVKVKEDGFGWNGTDVLVMAKLGKMGRYRYKVVNLSPGQSLQIPSSNDSLIVTGNGKESDLVDLHFGLYEVWSGKWKGGLEIIKAIVSQVNDS